MHAIYKREMRSYFTSPVGYIFIAIFIAVSAFLFSTYTVQAGENSSISSYFSIILFLFIVIVPLLTMKLISEELKMKTDQLIMTAPVGLWGVVLAKYFAAMTLIAGALVFTSAIYYIPLAMYGTPNAVIYIGNVFAVLLVGSAFTAIGTLISSLTENQFISAFATIAVILMLLMVGRLNSYINSSVLRLIISSISITTRYSNFANGIFDISALIYYISIAGLCIFLTVRVFEKRRWS